MTNVEMSPRRYLMVQTEPERKPIAVVTEVMRERLRVQIKTLEFIEVTNVRKVNSAIVFDRIKKNDN